MKKRSSLAQLGPLEAAANRNEGLAKRMNQSAPVSSSRQEWNLRTGSDKWPLESARFAPLATPHSLLQLLTKQVIRAKRRVYYASTEPRCINALNLTNEALMGHSDIHTTARYVRATQRNEREAVEAVMLGSQKLSTNWPHAKSGQVRWPP